MGQFTAQQYAIGLPAVLVVLTPILSYWFDGWGAKWMRNKRRWSLEAMPDMEGEIAVVTGGDAGVGYAIAQELARAGAKVVLASRNREKLKEAIARIEEETGCTEGNVDAIPVDLASLKSVEGFAKALEAKHPNVTILVNNAALMSWSPSLSVDGLELHFATNYLGHFVLTRKILKLLGNAGGKKRLSRIVHLGGSHADSLTPTGGIDFNSVTRAHMSWGDNYWMYAQSKLALVLFSQELDQRLYEDRTFVYSLVANPGTFVDSGVADSLTGLEGILMKALVTTIGMSADDAALTALYSAANPEAIWRRGDYLTTIGAPVPSSFSSYNVSLREKLWKKSEEMAEKVLGSGWAPKVGTGAMEGLMVLGSANRWSMSA